MEMRLQGITGYEGRSCGGWSRLFEDLGGGIPAPRSAPSSPHYRRAHDSFLVQDTVTGFLLAGVGQRDAQGANFLVVDASECC
jgi:hypothetical protein